MTKKIDIKWPHYMPIEIRHELKESDSTGGDERIIHVCSSVQVEIRYEDRAERRWLHSAIDFAASTPLSEQELDGIETIKFTNTFFMLKKFFLSDMAGEGS